MEPKDAALTGSSSGAPLERLELGVLLDRLYDASVVIDQGDSFGTETLRAIHRDCILEAIARLRAGDGAGAGTTEPITGQE